jgi:8-oxo-dGTP pyrophosphatase MutT (NUDIX family)
MKLRKTKTERWLSGLPKRVSSAALILENSIGQSLIVKANYKPYWTFPGGIVDPNETPKEAAVRELFEETGITVVADAVEFVAVIDRKSSFAQTYQFVFKSPLTSNMISDISLQPSEIDEYALVTKSQISTNDRHYGKVIEHWATNKTGYIEQVFGGKTDAE